MPTVVITTIQTCQIRVRYRVIVALAEYICNAETLPHLASYFHSKNQNDVDSLTTNHQAGHTQLPRCNSGV